MSRAALGRARYKSKKVNGCEVIEEEDDDNDDDNYKSSVEAVLAVPHNDGFWTGAAGAHSHLLLLAEAHTPMV